MKYIVYLTTNLKSLYKNTPKIYIGVHKTEDPEIFDGYIGCGCWVNQPASFKYPKTPFQCAVKKYGAENFKREVLYIYDTIEKAYEKEKELVTLDFIKQPHVYNSCEGGLGGYLGKPLYQFDLSGNLVKSWDYAIEAYEYYNAPRSQFEYAINGKYEFMNFYWARSNKIIVENYISSKHGQPKMIYLYDKDGNFIQLFNSEMDCAKYIGVQNAAISKAIKAKRLVRKNIMFQIYF